MVFPRQSSIVACQNLEGCVAFPRKPPKGMHRRCFRHYVRMLWHHCRTGFGDYLDRGLCAWWCTNSARIAQALAAYEPSITPQTSGDRIWGDIARKKTARPTIRKASYYSEIPRWDNNDAIRHQQTASGRFLRDKRGTRTWESWAGKHLAILSCQHLWTNRSFLVESCFCTLLRNRSKFEDVAFRRLLVLDHRTFYRGNHLYIATE